MAGVFPDGGVTAGQTTGADQTIVAADLANCAGNALFYKTSACPPRFDARATNVLISEFINAVNCLGRDYDCSRFDNLCQALLANLPCGNAPIYTGQLDCDDMLTVCVDGTARRMSVCDLPPYGCLPENFPVAGPSCSIEQLVMTTDANGCRRIARYSETSARLGTAIQATSPLCPNPGTDRFPINPADPNTFYNAAELENDIALNNVNQAKLDGNQLWELTIDVACTAAIDMDIRNTIVFDPATNGGNGAASRIAVSVDGVILQAATGIIRSPFISTNFERNSLGILTSTMAAGTHTIRGYAIADSPARPPAQYFFSCNPLGGSGSITASVAVA